MSEDTGESDDRFNVEILGVTIGTADGWDQFGDNGQQFTSFEASEKFTKFFYGDVEPDIICFDPFTHDKEAILVGYLDETEVKYNHKEFLKLIIEA